MLNQQVENGTRSVYTTSGICNVAISTNICMNQQTRQNGWYLRQADLLYLLVIYAIIRKDDIISNMIHSFRRYSIGRPNTALAPATNNNGCDTQKLPNILRHKTTILPKSMTLVRNWIVNGFIVICDFIVLAAIFIPAVFWVVVNWLLHFAGLFCYLLESWNHLLATFIVSNELRKMKFYFRSLGSTQSKPTGKLKVANGTELTMFMHSAILWTLIVIRIADYWKYALHLVHFWKIYLWHYRKQTEIVWLAGPQTHSFSACLRCLLFGINSVSNHWDTYFS